jgi:3-phosphoshikimate 1-carboxyvinyltransferase
MSSIIIDKRPRGEIRLPQSKSLCHRELICSFVHSYVNGLEFQEVENIEEYSNDIQATYNCLAQLYEMRNSEYDPILDCGESGSTLRFIIPLVLAIGRRASVTGTKKLMSRPNDEFLKSLEQPGVLIEQRLGPEVYIRRTKTTEQKPDYIALDGKLTKTDFTLPGNISSQYISALLMIEPIIGKINLNLTTELESAGYVDLTKEVVEKYRNIGKYSLKKELKNVEADYSNAAFFIVAAAFGANITIAGLNPKSLQGDKAILQVIEQAGIEYIWSNDKTPVLKVAPMSVILPIEVDVKNIPDLVPPIALLLSLAKGKSRIYNAERLRIKESDRLVSVSETLNKLGANVTIVNDELHIEGVDQLKSAAIDPFNDHRIAMMATVASLKTAPESGTVVIDNMESAFKSYPNFYKDFLSVV